MSHWCIIGPFGCAVWKPNQTELILVCLDDGGSELAPSGYLISSPLTVCFDDKRSLKVTFLL